MSWTIYVILILFGLFIILMIVNPNLSCFSRRIRSPFYPVTRKKKKIRSVSSVSKEYKFDLKEPDQKPEPASKSDSIKNKDKKAEDYGFKLN